MYVSILIPTFNRHRFSLNDEVIADGARQIEAGDVNADGVMKLAAGKKKIVLVRPV